MTLEQMNLDRTDNDVYNPTGFMNPMQGFSNQQPQEVNINLQAQSNVINKDTSQAQNLWTPEQIQNQGHQQ
jgi:hypothetical protein